MKKFALAALALCFFASLAPALEVGDKALPITPAQWVTGEPADPTQVDENTFYLVEVWSVTCPPCVRSIPILNDLQDRYADQGFKIVSFTSDDISQVNAFLEDHPMEYSSFIDEDGETYIKYMALDNRNTIPHAFLFDRHGYLVWIG
ncbi:MAG: TlpA family protein disulfide reductase, partial [Planctomycetes bacterium]|nr:TlpA family protein disulfide reductase [Planctomycetota bacterium]